MPLDVHFVRLVIFRTLSPLSWIQPVDITCTGHTGLLMAGPGDPDLRKVAERVWNTLDDLAERDPEEYKKFIDQQLKEGAQAQQNPQPVFCLQCDAKHRVCYKRRA